MKGAQVRLENANSVFMKHDKKDTASVSMGFIAQLPTLTCFGLIFKVFETEKGTFSLSALSQRRRGHLWHTKSLWKQKRVFVMAVHLMIAQFLS